MRIVENVRAVREVFPGLVLTIGSFDGIHLGHRRVLARLLQCARETGGTAALMTMRPHPRQFFSPGNAPNILTSDAKKTALLDEAGLDVLLVLPFDAEVANMPRRDFIEQLVVERCHPKRVIVGHDFAFGKEAKGDYAYLREVAPRYDFEVEEVAPLFLQGERVSSTLIRESILQGELDKVETFLGRRYSISGKVAQGRGMGVRLGFPTANIKPQGNPVPPHGVYVVEAILDGGRHAAAVNIGIAPTIRHEDIMIEAHLLDFDQDLIGKHIELEFHRRLRPEKKFKSVDDLIVAIHNDVRNVREYFDREHLESEPERDAPNV